MQSKTMTLGLVTFCVFVILQQPAMAELESRSGAFTAADEDGDGVLTPTELVGERSLVTILCLAATVITPVCWTAAVAAVGLRAPETNAERDSLVSRMDYNGDGKIDAVSAPSRRHALALSVADLVASFTVQTEFTTAVAKQDSFVGKLGVVCTRFLDNGANHALYRLDRHPKARTNSVASIAVGILNLVNQFGAACGIDMGNEVGNPLYVI